MAEVVVLRASLPVGHLADGFLRALQRGADVDLVVSGLRSRLLPGVVQRLCAGGTGTVEALAYAPLFPKELGLLLQARRLGRRLQCREVAGAREVVVEIRGA